MNPLVVVVGPTAVGKSALALYMATALDGEIISADSRQIYRHMDIGTAKPTQRERALVPHHLIDVVNPDEEFTLASFQELAYRAIDDVESRGRVPFLVGGTGLYIRAVTEGLRIPHVVPNQELRCRMEQKASKEGFGALFTDLQTVDPMSAARIDPRNVRRVIRALEVYEITGKTFSSFARKEAPPYEIVTLGVTLPREELYRRIDSRVDNMVLDGLIDEVNRLVQMGYGLNLPAMSGIGYRQVCAYINGELSRDETLQLIKHETHRFARQQYTWFRPGNTSIRWLQADDGYLEAGLTEVARYLEGLVV